MFFKPTHFGWARWRIAKVAKESYFGVKDGVRTACGEHHAIANSKHPGANLSLILNQFSHIYMSKCNGMKFRWDGEWAPPWNWTYYNTPLPVDICPMYQKQVASTLHNPSALWRSLLSDCHSHLVCHLHWCKLGTGMNLSADLQTTRTSSRCLEDVDWPTSSCCCIWEGCC